MNNRRQESGDYLSGHLGALGQEPQKLNTYRFLVFLQCHMSSVDTQRGDLNPLIRERPRFPFPVQCFPSSCQQSVSSVFSLDDASHLYQVLQRWKQLLGFACLSPGFAICFRLFFSWVSFYYVIALLCQIFLFTTNFTVSLYKMPVEKIQCL